MSDAAERFDALEARVLELEQRIAEAGRRALFHADTAGEPVRVRAALADVGRALLFDPETPPAA
jgi:hypothetical protein